MCSVGGRLREERERLGFSQEDFGRLGGVNRNTQANYEKGLRSPDSAYLAGISAAGTDVLYVVTGHRTPSKEEGLSVKEEAVLQNFRSLSEGDQKAVQRLTHALAESPEEHNGNDESGTAG